MIRSTFGAQRVAAYVVAALLVAMAYPYVMLRLSRRDMTAQISERLASGAQVGAGEIDGWVQAVRMQAITLAEVAATEDASVRTQPILDSLRAAGAFSAAWIIGQDGQTLAKTVNAGEHQPVSDGPHVVNTSDGFFLDFAARSGRGASPVVIVRSPFNAETFRRLNPTAYAKTRTTRSTVLWPDGDSVFVVVSESREPLGGVPRAYSRKSLPRTISEAITQPFARGEGPAIAEDRAYYASMRVRSLDLPLIRQVAESEVLEPARAALFLQGALIAGLLLSLAMLSESRWRAAQFRREQKVTQLRDDFVSSVSHELRTPLAQIRMYAELLRQGSMSGADDTARALYVIEKEARRLTILVDNILSFAHLRRRSDELVTRPCAVFDDVHFVIEAFGPLAAERGVTVTSNVPEDVYARVDSLALRQILLNFLENAAKYGPRDQTISIVGTADATTVTLTVDDEGPGVPADERDQVWTPFYRGASSEASDITGSGIGLSVVRDLVSRHDGKSFVTDSPAGGARFVISFARAEAPAARMHAPARSLDASRA